MSNPSANVYVTVEEMIKFLERFDPQAKVEFSVEHSSIRVVPWERFGKEQPHITLMPIDDLERE